MRLSPTWRFANKFPSINPMGRMITPGEVAETVAWLCLPSSAAVTGQSIAVCGGPVSG